MIAVQPIFTIIKNECGSLFSTEAHPDSSILRYIGSAIRYIANYRDYEFLKKKFDVTVISPDVEVTTIEKVKTLLVMKGGAEYIPTGIEGYFHPNATSEYVGSWGESFYAKEIGTYTVISSVIPTVPTADTDTIDLPGYLSDIIVTLAMHYAYMDIRIYSEATEKLNMANAMLDTVSNRASNAYPTHSVTMKVKSPV